jgi:hypothetical protein
VQQVPVTLCGKQHLVAGLEQAGSEVAVNREPAFNCLGRQFFHVVHGLIPREAVGSATFSFQTQRRNEAAAVSASTAFL